MANKIYDLEFKSINFNIYNIILQLVMQNQEMQKNYQKKTQNMNLEYIFQEKIQKKKLLKIYQQKK